jgi:hypothetical protein
MINPALLRMSILTVLDLGSDLEASLGRFLPRYGPWVLCTFFPGKSFTGHADAIANAGKCSFCSFECDGERQTTEAPLF